jgi:flagellar biosynthetic protein FliS
MSIAKQQQYLESMVLTASSHRLHLMLIDVAIRMGRQADQALRQRDRANADRPLMKLLEILGEMVAGVRRVKSELNAQIESLYLFIYRCVAEAKINNDIGKLAEAMRLLEFERETWQQACDKSAPQSAGVSLGPMLGEAPAKTTGTRHVSPNRAASTAANRLSLEA